VSWNELREQVLILVKRWLDGDLTAWQELGPLLFKILYAKIKRIVHNTHDREDLAQEATLRILVKIGLYRPEVGSFLDWACSIAVNVALDFLRKEKGKVWFSLSAIDELEDSSHDRAKTVCDDERQSAFVQCLAEMPAHYRLVVCLRFDGWKNEEIADLLDMPYSTVGSRFSKGKLMLTNCLRTKFPDLFS
jgi:RNA polymerase sigma factor (sigma-70 family)